MMKKFLGIILSMLFLINCGRQDRAAIKISYKGDRKIPVVTISDKNLEEPLKIVALEEKSAGSFYFLTDNGKKWIQGEPDTKQVTKNRAIWEWRLTNRRVSMEIEKVENDFQLKLSASPNDSVLGWGINFAASADEYFTGLFERTVDGPQEASWAEGIQEAMNLRGQQVDMIIKPTLSLYSPFYISSRGYGLHVNGTWPGRYDFCNEENDRVQIFFEGPSLSGKLYLREDIKEIVKAHTIDTGPPILPPKWTFSHWRWRDNHSNLDEYFDGTAVNAPYNSMVVEDILMMEALDIPSGAYWVDRPWAIGKYGYDDFIWDRERLPNPEKMIQWLHAKDKQFLLWIAPWVMGDMAEEAQEKKYNLPLKKGRETSDRVLIDYTNPEASQWWQKKGPEKLIKIGVDGFKLDRAEELVPETRAIIAHDGRTARELRNDYPVEYLKATYQAATNVRDSNFVLMPRAAYTGSAKYGIFWGGDIDSPQEGLRSAIIALLRSSIIGYPIWGSDIGGYWGGDLDHEITARWLAFGAFCPLMEVGPTEDNGLWDLNIPPSYDPQLLATWRTYAKLHTKLMDYTYKHAELAHSQGTPIARPLFLEYPEQKQAWTEWQTYLYGSDILVAPIWQKGTRTREIYLPQGEKWIDAWDRDKIYNGGQTVTVSTPVHKIPLFIKKDSSLDLGDLNQLYQESLGITKNKPDMKELQRNADFSIAQ